MKSRRILMIAIFLIPITLIISSIFIILCVFISRNNDSHNKSISHFFQYTEIQPDTHITTSGFVRLPEDRIEDNSFISYKNDETGALVVISKSGGESYECTGSCHCSSTPERRTTTLLTRSLTLIISAFSTSMAVSVAHKTFENSCIKKFSETCDEKDIIVDVSSCDQEEEEEEEEFKIEIRPKEKKYLNKLREYSCAGQCVKNWIPLTAEGKKALEAHSLDCDSLMTVGRIQVRLTEVAIARQLLNALSVPKDQFPSHNKLWYLSAKFIFADTFLEPFCFTNSKFTYWHRFPDSMVEEEIDKKKLLQGGSCVGKNDRDTVNFGLGNIECYEYDAEEADQIWEERTELKL